MAQVNKENVLKLFLKEKQHVGSNRKTVLPDTTEPDENGDTKPLMKKSRHDGKWYLLSKYYTDEYGNPRPVNIDAWKCDVYDDRDGTWKKAAGVKYFDSQVRHRLAQKEDPTLPDWEDVKATLYWEDVNTLNQWTSWKPMVNPDGKLPKRDKNFLGFEPKDKDGYHMGGIYLYAFDETGDIVNDDVDILDDRIIYNGAAGSTKHRGILHRSQDFMGSVLQGENQKRPYHNGMIFREKFGIENHVHLYSAYFPMGFGLDKQIYHDEEMRVQAMIMKHKGELPPCHGSYDSVNLRQVKDAINAGIFSDSELKEILKIIVNKL